MTKTECIPPTIIDAPKDDMELELLLKENNMSAIHLFFRNNTGGICSILLVVAIYLCIILPETYSKWLRPFFMLHGSVYKDGQFLYQKDIKDLCTVFTITLLLTSIRHCFSNTWFIYIRKGLKIHNNLEQPDMEHKTLEQEWLVLYYLFSFSAGIVMIYKYIGFSLDNVWRDYPVLFYAWDYKMYYLIQSSFYIHSILTLFIEKHRKDMKNMLIHHLLTLVLIISSYYTNFTRIGIVTFAIFDVADILLPASKICQYAWLVIIGYSIFFIFTLTWIITRQYLVCVLMWSIYSRAEELLPLLWDPPNGYFVSKTWSKPFFLALFALLEVLQIVWNILKLIYLQLFKGKIIQDDRSNRSDEEEQDKKE